MRTKSSSIALPPGAVARLFNMPKGHCEQWLVVVACPPTPAEPSALMARGRVSALFTHDAGVVWPDTSGVILAEETLTAGGAVGLAFVSLVDALACHRRLLEGGAANG